MKKFLTRIVVFFIPIFIIWGVLEWAIVKIPNDYTYKKNQFEKKKADIETLILGSSHAFFDINPEYLGHRSFNLANVSQSLYYDNILFKKYIKELPGLKNLVLTISYFSLSQKLNSAEEQWRKYLYKKYMGITSGIVFPIDPKGYSVILAQPFEMSFEQLNKYYLQRKSILTSDDNGWGFVYTADIRVDLHESSLKTSLRHEDHSMDFSDNLNRVEEILEICRQRNINVFLVYPPGYEEYRKMLNPEKNKKIISTCQSLTEKYPNVHYLNHFADPAFSADDFYDADHLLDSGAEKFSLLLKKEMDTSK